MERRITPTVTLIFLSVSTAFSAAPGIQVKSVQTLSPSQRWAKVAQGLAHGKSGHGAKGPSHPIPQPDKDNSALAHWKGSFNSGGKHYSFTMVGTDPSNGSATTVIDTAVIPYKLIFSDGTVFDAGKDLIDGQTPLNGALNSPVFNNVPFKAGGANVGDTQFGDAMLRSSFWNVVSTHSPGYHVLLHPHVMPLQVLNVPADLGQTFLDTSTGRKFGVVDLVWLDNTLVNTMMQLDIEPSTLAVHQFGEIIGAGLNGGGALGYHNAVDFTGNTFKIKGAVTYIFSDWFSNAAFGNEVGIGNTGTLGHEIAEWLNDPFVDNTVPYWQDPGTPNLCEQDYLEVGDPLENLNYFTATSAGFAYSLPDVAFLPWFERVSPSTSVNGWYTFLNQLPGFSKACPGFTDFGITAVDYPGAAATVFTGINNHQQLSGYWLDSSNNEHSFIYDGKHFTPVNVPGSNFVQANKLNDGGEVVGYYLDGASKQHGFTWVNGHVTTVDYPGAASTTLNSLDNGPNPELVGYYLDAGNVAHGFELTNNHFDIVTVPSAVDVYVNGINNADRLVGSSDNGNPANGLGFVGTQGFFTPLSFPSEFYSTVTGAFSLSNTNQVVGVFSDYATHGFLEIQGLYGEVDGGLDFDGAFLTVLYDNNDAAVMVGAYQDLTGLHGFIATPVSN
jgi:hypothetical protein